ncbi:MAG: hypothetical protein GY841_21365 [FCB group bacterium]|nr:hypothetical protein [FCB group bacterium]
MNKQKIAKIKRKLKSLQKKMSEIGPVMRGSVVFIGNPKKYCHFSLNKDKKTHLIYLGNKREARAREYSNNYKKLLDIIEEMTLLNMTLLKENIDVDSH